MTRKNTWTLVGVLVAVVLGGAGLGLYFTPGLFGPPPLTGDRASDATCAAAISPFIENGQPEKARLFGMTGEERRAMVEAVEDAARDATVVDIREAADDMVLSLSLADNGLFGQMAFITRYGKLAEACTSHGWTAVKAGLVDSE